TNSNRKPGSVSETSSAPTPYRVAYSERVRNELRELIATAKARGLVPQVLAAVKEMDQRLRIYPQFGEPIRDLKLEPAQIWVGVVGPLVVQYVLDEERRLVMVVGPIRALPEAGA